jgi:hypothetical protein
MSDRDTFAAAALTGLLSNNYFSLGDEAAKRCYGYADSMLRERERPDRSQPIKPADATPTTHTTPAEGTVHGDCTFTAEEREAVDGVVAFLFGLSDTCVQVGTRQTLRERAATLRNLLKRLAVE